MTISRYCPVAVYCVVTALWEITTSLDVGVIGVGVIPRVTYSRIKKDRGPGFHLLFFKDFEFLFYTGYLTATYD